MKTLLTLLISLSCFGAMGQTAVTNNIWANRWTNIVLLDWTSAQILVGTNHTAPVHFEQQCGGCEITNMVILTNYTGTIQVGEKFYRIYDTTNFFTAKELKSDGQ